MVVTQLGDDSRFKVGDWTATPTLYLLERHGHSIKIKPRTMQVLVYLARHAGEIISANELIASVWQGRVVGDGSVYQTINQLRQALGERNDDRYIQTIPKRGYRLVASVSAMDPAPSEEVSARAVGQLRRRKIGFALAGVLVLTLAVLGVRYIGEEGRGVLPNSIAVLPFENLSPNPDDSYFAVGIHEAVLNELAKISAMNVIARTSTLPYADRTTPIAEIARELGVETVMEGSVQYAEGRVRITVQLIDPVTRAHLWSEDYDRDFVDIFAIQSDIAINIANALMAEFSLEERESIERQPTDSIAAYTLYLRALTLPPEETPDYLDEAIALDPEFALAYALRAYSEAYDLIGINGASPSEAAELEQIVREDAELALALDPTLGPAHAALAVIHYANWRRTDAEEAFEQAYQFAVASQLALEYGRFKRYLGDYDEAIQIQRRGYELDPGNWQLYYQLGLSYRAGRYYREAGSIFRELSDVDAIASRAHLQIGRVAVNLGNYEEAVKELRLAESFREGFEFNAFRVGQLILSYSLAGSDEDVSRLFNALQAIASNEPVGHAVWARAYLALGDREQTLQHIRAAVDERRSTDVPTLSELSQNPWDHQMLDEPEFRELLDGLWDGE